MKKLIAMLLTLAMVLSLAACGAQSTPTQAATEAPAAAETKAPAATEAPAAKEIKVGIAAPDVTHGWVAGVAYYAEKYCKENNLDYMITTSKDAASMTTALDDLVAWARRSSSPGPSGPAWRPLCRTSSTAASPL